MANWTPTLIAQPPNGDAVLVITSSGEERFLRFHDNLWWLPDDSMYVYFAPTFWRTLETPDAP